MATRLRPLTAHTPKCLLSVGGKALLGRALDALLSNGIHEAIIVTGYLADQIEAYVRQDYPHMAVRFVHNPRYESTNNIYSLYLSKEHACGRDILLLDSDILFDPEIIRRLLACPDPEALALCSEPLMNEVLDTGTPAPETVITAIARRQVFPVFFGAALRLDGLDGLLRGLQS